MTRPTGEPTVEELRSFYFAVHAHQKNARAFSVHFSWQNARAARMRQFSGPFGPSGKRARTGEEASCAFTMAGDNGLDKVPEKGEGSNGSDIVVTEQMEEQVELAAPSPARTLAAAPPPQSPPSALLTFPDPRNSLNPGAASSEVPASEYFMMRPRNESARVMKVVMSGAASSSSAQAASQSTRLGGVLVLMSAEDNNSSQRVASTVNNIGSMTSSISSIDTSAVRHTANTRTTLAERRCVSSRQLAAAPPLADSHCNASQLPRREMPATSGSAVATCPHRDEYCAMHSPLASLGRVSLIVPHKNARISKYSPTHIHHSPQEFHIIRHTNIKWNSDIVLFSLLTLAVLFARMPVTQTHTHAHTHTHTHTHTHSCPLASFCTNLSTEEYVSMTTGGWLAAAQLLSRQAYAEHSFPAHTVATHTCVC
jgi:hypothetical protein